MPLAPLNVFTLLLYDLPLMLKGCCTSKPLPKMGWKLELEGARAISASQKLAQKLRDIYLKGQDELARKETRLESLDEKVAQLDTKVDQILSQLRKMRQANP